MAKDKVAGIALRDSWDYDFIRPWMDRDKQIAAVEEALKCECDFELPILRLNLGCDIDEILGLNRVTQNRVFIQYDKQTLDYLLGKSSEVIEQLTEAVVSGIQKGLETTVLHQKMVKEGYRLFDTGYEHSLDMENGIRQTLNNDERLSNWFTQKQINHMVHYFGSKYDVKILFS